jgi:hypothetical protein
MVDQIAMRHADIVGDSDQRHAAGAVLQKEFARGGERFVARLSGRAGAPNATASGISSDYGH